MNLALRRGIAPGDFDYFTVGSLLEVLLYKPDESAAYSDPDEVRAFLGV